MTVTASTAARQFRDPRVHCAVASPKPDEMAAVRAILVREKLLGDHGRVAYFGLYEPDKHGLLNSLETGEPDPRYFRVMVLDTATGDEYDIVVSPSQDRIVSADKHDTSDGRVPVLLSEMIMVEEIVHTDERWLAAMAKRGLTDLSVLRVQPLSAGVSKTPDENGRRLQRCFTFIQTDPDDLAWAHPVDGVTAVVDVITREVISVIDYVEIGVPEEAGNFHLDSFNPPPRQGFRPIEITQPEGPSFTIDRETNVLEWLGWKLQLGFDAREGLIIRNVTIADGGVDRSVLYRGSISEMVVPYGDPSEQRSFQNFFDGGEFLLGQCANALELGCDCLGEITYLDAHVMGEDGNVVTIPQAICIHEEDDGVLWKHTSSFTRTTSIRRKRKLVVSFFVTVGNYDYGFYWYFSVDGSIELEVKATGVVFTSALPVTDGSYPWATQMTPNLGAPNHQHLWVMRLDMALDGHNAAVDEIEAVRPTPSERDPQGIGLTQSITRLRRESESGRMADNAVGRVWRISNPDSTNRLGHPVSYVIAPEGHPALLADEGSDIYQRAAAASKHLWVTAYERGELYPTGDFVNQHPGGAGMLSWIKADRDIDGTDTVVWHTFGLTHFPRPEDWPIMPVDTAGFVMKPYGFFDCDPTLDVPKQPKSCHTSCEG
jgi:primary-amine oxidase